MNKGGFVLLWEKILDSSIWLESNETRLVWITLLLLKDSEGKVFCHPAILASRARVEEGKCREALEKLMAPDKESGSPQEEGRRILPIQGGWYVVNHEYYRFSTEAKRELWRQQKKEQRLGEAKARKSRSQVRRENNGREMRYVRALERGDTQECDKIAAEGLAEGMRNRNGDHEQEAKEKETGV